METDFLRIQSADDLTPHLYEVIDLVFEGWWIDAPRIDWNAFIDRVEAFGQFDFGSSMDSEAIKAIKRHVRRLRATQ